MQTVSGNRTGYVRVHVNELVEKLGLRSMGLAGLMETQIASAIHSYLEGESEPKVELGNLDQFHGHLTFGIHEMEQPNADGHRRRMQIGFGMTMLRLREARDWGQWLSDNVPGTRRFERDGQQVMLLPTIALLGPVPIALAQPDPRTVADGIVVLKRRDRNASLGGHHV